MKVNHIPNNQEGYSKYSFLSLRCFEITISYLDFNFLKLGIVVNIFPIIHLNPLIYFDLFQSEKWPQISLSLRLPLSLSFKKGGINVAS